MGAIHKLNLLLAVVFLLISYSLYTSVPSDLEEPWLVRTYIAALKSANFLANSVEILTSVSSTTVLRYLVKAVYSPVRATHENVIVEDLKMNGVAVRLYRPNLFLQELNPCILYIHGVGWSIFDIDSYDTITADLAYHTNSLVVSVRYRLSPEHPFPIPFDDCLKVTQHILQSGLKYKIDRGRVAVVGDSTGANLATAVAQRISEEDPGHTPHIKLQVLLQPVLQAFNFDTPSYRQYADNTFFGRTQMIRFWCEYLGVVPTKDVRTSMERNEHVTPQLRTSVYSQYLSETQLPASVRTRTMPSPLDRYTNSYNTKLAQEVESKVIDPFVSPLLADSLVGSPPAYILVAEFDVVRDDGLLYASRLQSQNIKVHLKFVENQSHSFLIPTSSFLTFSSANKTWFEIYQFIKHNL